MRILLVGAGGVGNAIAKIAARRSFFDAMVVSDYDLARAESTIAWIRAKHGPHPTRTTSRNWRCGTGSPTS
jgi:predicted dinucleotide-utilizing enzyme